MSLDLPLLRSGKVRELYELDAERVLMVASDRVSTYDVVHPTPVPDKGAVLTALSAFWFQRLAGMVPTHLLSGTDGVPAEVRGRALAVRRLEMLPLECVVRGHLAGSAWEDYQRTGRVGDVELPAGLREAERLDAPVFTPATKAAEGEHDETIGFDRAVEFVGDRPLAEELRRLSLQLFDVAREHALDRGFILADAKLEFGVDADGELTLGDEAFTPDASRLWRSEDWAPGRTPPGFDKQPVRDWAAGTGWDRSEPAPALPVEVVEQTRARYREAYERLSGEPLDAWLERTAA